MVRKKYDFMEIGPNVLSWFPYFPCDIQENRDTNVNISQKGTKTCSSNNIRYVFADLGVVRPGKTTNFRETSKLNNKLILSLVENLAIDVVEPSRK